MISLVPFCFSNIRSIDTILAIFHSFFKVVVLNASNDDCIRVLSRDCNGGLFKTIIERKQVEMGNGVSFSIIIQVLPTFCFLPKKSYFSHK